MRPSLGSKSRHPSRHAHHAARRRDGARASSRAPRLQADRHQVADADEIPSWPPPPATRQLRSSGDVSSDERWEQGRNRPEGDTTIEQVPTAAAEHFSSLGRGRRR
jgi:hypothetical protein